MDNEEEHAKPRNISDRNREAVRGRSPKGVRAAFRVIGNKEDAEDILHNVFLKLIEEKSPADFSVSPVGYLCRMAINEALKLMQSKVRQTPIEDNVDEIENEASASSAGVIVNEERLQLMRKAMEQLKPELLELLVLHYKGGLSIREIAKTQGRPLGTVCCDLFRARAEVRRLMESEEENNETQKEDRTADSR